MIKHIFTVFILLIGVSTIVSGQTDTTQVIIEDSPSIEFGDTSILYGKYLDYVPVDEPNQVELYQYNPILSQDTMYFRFFVEGGGFYAINRNKSFMEETLHKVGGRFSCGTVNRFEHAISTFHLSSYESSIPTSPYVHGGFRIDSIDYPSHYREFFSMRYSYVNNFVNRQHFIGAKFEGSYQSVHLTDTMSTDTDFTGILGYSTTSFDIGIAYSYYTSLWNKPLNVHFSLPVFIASITTLDEGFFYEQDEYISNFGTLNHALLPQLELEFMLISKKRRPAVSVMYNCNFRSIKYLKDASRVNELAQSIGLRFYFGNYDAFMALAEAIADPPYPLHTY